VGEASALQECDAVGERLKLRLAAIEEVQSAVKGMEALSSLVTLGVVLWLITGLWSTAITGSAVVFVVVVGFLVSGTLSMLETWAIRAMMRRVNRLHPMPGGEQ
jgi:hypothetical protein